MYRYIGNKTKLLPHILNRVRELIGDTGIVADIMAGTGSVALELKKQNYTVIASDVMTYSYHHLVTNLQLSEYPKFMYLRDLIGVSKDDISYFKVLDYLNSISPEKGFFFREFSPNGTPLNGTPPRKYFTSENAEKIDAIRVCLNEWIETKRINDKEASLLKHTLIMAVNEVANISGTYGYFLSTFKNNSTNKIWLKPVEIEPNNSKVHTVMHGFAEDLSRLISADLCYIDPPYMKRQYAANYHILETIARGDFPDAIGKSGLRDWWDQHSKLCTKTKGLQSFEKIMSEMCCNKFLVSYSEDGLFSLEQLEACFNKFGDVTIQQIDYNRFKSNDSKLPSKLKEYLISVER